MTWKSYLAVSALGLAGTYMASSPLLPPLAPAANPETAAAALPSGDIEREAARLAAGLRAEAAYRAPTRNPFRFGARVQAPAAQAAPQPAVTLPPAPPEPPFVVLSGIGTDVVDGAIVRTAVLTTAAGVTLAKVGDLVGTDYRVREIREDGVDLESIGDGTIRQLRFAAGVR